MKQQYIRTTETGTTYEIAGWETNVVYNPYTFTWLAWEEPVVKKQMVKKVKMIPVSEFDRPPVFDGACLTEKDQFVCSNEKLREYMAETSVDYPNVAQQLGQEGLEYVTFTIDKDGNIKGNMRVVSKDDPCKGCAAAAADLVASMEEKWFPAIKDGRPVETQLTIPVRFKLMAK